MFGQTVRLEIDAIVNGIAKNRSLRTRYPQNEQWIRYIYLKEKATNEELIALTNHRNEVVRCYAFQALATRKGIEIFPILVNHLKDTSKIRIFEPCTLSEEYVGDYFYEIISGRYGDIGSYKLTDIEIYSIDSILLFDKEIKLSAKSKILRRLNPEEKYYKRIRDIVFEGKDNNALIALSKYQKQQDKEFIIERLNSSRTDIQYYGLQSVMNFPDSSFFSYLKDILKVEIEKPTGFNYGLIRTLYQGIIQYKNIQSRELLEQTLNLTKGSTLQYHSEFIWLAIELYPDPIYEGIQGRIKLSDYTRSDLQYWIDNKERW